MAGKRETVAEKLARLKLIEDEAARKAAKKEAAKARRESSAAERAAAQKRWERRAQPMLAKALAAVVPAGYEVLREPNHYDRWGADKELALRMALRRYGETHELKVVHRVGFADNHWNRNYDEPPQIFTHAEYMVLGKLRENREIVSPCLNCQGSGLVVGVQSDAAKLADWLEERGHRAAAVDVRRTFLQPQPASANDEDEDEEDLD